MTTKQAIVFPHIIFTFTSSQYCGVLSNISIMKAQVFVTFE
jgi:hypothetical protein